MMKKLMDWLIEFFTVDIDPPGTNWEVPDNDIVESLESGYQYIIH